MRLRTALLCTLTLISSFAGAEKLDTGPLNQFGTRLLREVIANDEQGVINRMVSPVANFMALGMTLEGTAGATRDELIKALHLSPGDQLAELNLECARRLISAPSENEKTLARLKISNGAWASNQLSGGRPFVFNEAYRHSLATSYAAEVGDLDFKAPGAAPAINAWAERETLGLIPTVVSADEVKNLIFLLMNATYFEGSWTEPFYLNEPDDWNVDRTTFKLAGGTTGRRAMITNVGHYAHVKNGDEEFIEIPFDSPAGKQFVFYVALPGNGRGLPGDYWDVQSWAQIRRSLDAARPELGSLTLPKFSFDYTYEMTGGNALTRAMGIEFLFADHANFDAMSTPESLRAKVGLIKGVNRIELDEKGVKAAAVVMVGGIECASAPEAPKFDMRGNRPFAFAIAEKTTGALVFVGEVHDPKP